MRTLFLAATLCLTAPLGACAPNSGAAAEESKSALVTITAGAAKYRFRVEVARTPDEQRQGLMFRTALAADGGMLFPFEKPRLASFWMKNTLIPLDIIFIRADGTIDRIAENTIPESLEPVVSGGDVAAVLEVAGGTASRLGLDDTATVRWDPK